MKTNKINITIAVIVLLATIFLAISFVSNTMRAGASAPSGLPATIATTSKPVVTSTAGILFATSSNCAARVVSTASSSVMLLFSDYAGQVPDASFGHFQATSSNVVYDAGLYGCNAVKVWSFATQQITVSESR